MQPHGRPNSFRARSRANGTASKRTSVVAHHASDVLRRLESNLFPEIGDKRDCGYHGPGAVGRSPED
jgi:hypothetical protein